MNADHNWTGNNYPNRQPYLEFPPTPPAGSRLFEHGGNESFGPIHRTSHLAAQHSSAEQNYSLGPYDRERARFLDPGAAGWPYGAASGIYPGFGIAQQIPAAFDEASVAVPINPLSPLPAGMVGNQRATEVPVQLPPVIVNNPRARRSSRRKLSASPDGRHEEKRIRRRTPQYLIAREQNRVSLAGIDLQLLRKGF